MADPRIIDPALQARVVSEFNLLGELSPFVLTNRVVPIFDIGSLSGATPTVVTTTAGSQGVRVGTASIVEALPIIDPTIQDTDVVDSGVVAAPAAGAVLADTGQLPGGIRFCAGLINTNAPITDFRVEWRNAANAASLAIWHFYVGVGGPSATWGPFTLQVLLNERVRIVNGSLNAGTTAAATIQATAINPSLAT